MKVYVLTEGKYSGRQNLGVFSEENKKEGERIADLLRGDLEGPFELNGFDYEEPPVGMEYFFVEMGRSGESSIYDSAVLNDEGKKREVEYKQRQKGDPYTEYERKSYWCLYVSLYAKDEKAAVKITNEIRVQILAGAKPKEGSIP